ncbi:MAG: ANTAR domain-containing protein [Clostridiales Family XIII bacterium]|nr:ANTAR domain-containing protein [Clostridiales Family XIII bacterium]
MESILVISGTEKGREYFRDFILACRYGSDVALAADAASALAFLGAREYGLCIVNAPLPDASGIELALSAAKQGCCQSLLVVSEDLAEKVRTRVEPHGVFVITKPVKRAVLWSSLKNIAVVHNRMTAMKEQNEDLKQKLEDVKLVNRAKSILITNLKMSEPQAHRFIEKQAMERRVTRAEMARRVINTYEE